MGIAADGFAAFHGVASVLVGQYKYWTTQGDHFPNSLGIDSHVPHLLAARRTKRKFDKFVNG